MPDLEIGCSYCNKTFFRNKKRVNEANKFGWKSYCSLKCLQQARDKQLSSVCCNPPCKKIFKRSLKELSKLKQYFCSQSCAAIVNNQTRYLKQPKRVCLNPICSNFVSRKNKFCSIKCASEARKLSDETSRKKVLDAIRVFKERNGRIPLRQEMWGVCKTAKKIFGSWNNAIKKAGFDPNPVKFARKHFAFDGHKCDSFAEFVIDNWLYKNKIPHQIHKSYPHSTLKSDFLIGDTRIEFIGLEGEIKKYDRLLKRKRNLTRRGKLKVIEIYPQDLFPQINLHKVFKPLLKKE